MSNDVPEYPRDRGVMPPLPIAIATINGTLIYSEAQMRGVMEACFMAGREYQQDKCHDQS